MSLAYYLLKVVLCSGILLGYYWLALRNKSFHQWNRFYLLAAVALSIILPLITIPLAHDRGSEVVRYISVATLDDAVVAMAKEKPFISFSAEQWMAVVYAAISLLLLGVIARSAKGILNILKSHPVQKIEQVCFVNTEAPGTPFSFFNYLVWNKHIDLKSSTGRQIFRHELAHIQQKHSLDKVFLLIVLIPFWANPFFWIIRRELNDIHEFIADQKALQSGSAEELSKMILNALYPQHAYLLAHPFFQSSIKRRLQMFAIQNQKINYMSRILVLPVLFIVTVAFSLKQEGQKEKETFFNQRQKSDTIPSNMNGKGAYKNDVITLVADHVVFNNIPSQSSSGEGMGLFIVNGKEMDSSSLSGKTVISKKVTVYQPDNAEAVKLYGADAKGGVMIFEDANIVSKTENKINQELQRDTVPKKEKESPVFTKVDEEAKFKGDWGAFLRQNLNSKVPLNNNASPGKYTVIVQFIVDKNGTVRDPEPVTNKGFGMEAEVIRVMKLSSAWEPAKVNGRDVSAYRKQPVTFVVSAK